MSDEPRYVVIINGNRYELRDPILVGLQARILADLAPDMTLIVEGEPDRQLADTEQLDLRSGPVSIFSKPPTQFGAGA